MFCNGKGYEQGQAGMQYYIISCWAAVGMKEWQYETWNYGTQTHGIGMGLSDGCQSPGELLTQGQASCLQLSFQGHC